MLTGTREFVHPALLYRDADEYLAGTVPFIQDGLAAGEPVAVAVPGPNLDLLRAALGTDAPRVRLMDMRVAGRNPGRIIPTVLLPFADAHPDRRVRIIGEPIWAGRSVLEYPACAQHEALINAAFAGRAATILCPYDTARLDPNWIRDAYRTHPVVHTPAEQWDSPEYRDPVTVAAEFNLPLDTPPADAATMVAAMDNLPAIRQLVADRARQAGLVADRVGHLIIAMNELASNSIAHGGGTGEVSVWTEDTSFVGQVRDGGRLTDPLAGRRPVAADEATGGRGLLLVNHLCDLVRVHSDSAGTTIQVHVWR